MTKEAKEAEIMRVKEALVVPNVTMVDGKLPL